MIFERGYFDRSRVQDSTISKSLHESRSFSSQVNHSIQPTVFLSHKHDDTQDLQGVMGKLEEFGAKVYIDSMDNNMPDKTSGETALKIKEVIKHCDKFILLATNKAIESYWCNWELGIGDTEKYIDHIAILPIKEKGVSDSQYKGNEYLQIYPQIHYEDGTHYYRNSDELIPRGFYVRKPKNKEGVHTITPIKRWLNK